MSFRYIDAIETLARNKIGMPASWRVLSWKNIRGGGVLLKGVCCPLVTRGKGKGRPNLRKRDMTTQRYVFLAAEDYDAALETAVRQESRRANQ